jgi:Arc/MetJ family transcription regulator
MQITLNLDESLLAEALQLTKFTTQEELMNLALQELVRSRRKKNLLGLAGQIQFTENFEHKAMRETLFSNVSAKEEQLDPNESSLQNRWQKIWLSIRGNISSKS